MKRFVFSFQKRFAELVESGRKQQTIRARRKDNRIPHVGDLAACYAGMRTRQCRKLGEWPITRVARITIDVPARIAIVDGHVLDAGEREVLAVADGFETFDHLCEWFGETHITDHFHGFLTVWSYDDGNQSGRTSKSGLIAQ